MHTVKTILMSAINCLEKNHVIDARFSSTELLAEVLGCSRLDIYLFFDRDLSDLEKKRFDQMIERRARKEPVVYILGKMTFYGCSLMVNPDTLIPRPETEIMVDLIVKVLQKEDLHGKTLWDIGCGSGCIGIALKKQFPMLEVIMSDVSQKALDKARENSLLNQVDCQFLQGKGLLPFKGRKADYIVSNPPYIAEKEFQYLDSDVKDFEPKGALISGSEGTEFFQQFAQDFSLYITKPAKIFFEIGNNQGKKVQKIFNYQGKVLRDWSEHDRFFFLEIE